MSRFDLHDIPRPAPLRFPAPAEHTLPNGLRVIVARRTGTPLAELRLGIPFAHADPATAILLSTAITADPEVLQRARLIGATLSASVDADLLRIAGSVLAPDLGRLLALLADVVLAPRHPVPGFRGVVDSTVQTTTALLASPAYRVVEALNERMFGDHPYGLPTPRAAELRAVTPDALDALHRDRVRAAGATLVVAGAVEPDAVVDDVERLLGAWSSGPTPRSLRPVPAPVPGSLIVDEPGVAQSLLRVTVPVPRRDAPDHPALAMAVMVLGGFFSSRLVQNIREDKGFSYSPRSSLLHVRDADMATISVDVVTANTAAAAREIDAELAGLVSRPVTDEELDRGRRFAAGTLRLRTATLSGVVATLGELDLQQLPLTWPGDYDARLAAVTPEQVTAAAAAHLGPERALSVWLCDAARAFPT